ncbi:MAG: ATP-binding protein [Synergistaceae bacterium]|nr:ATP-binding protein [Synergistaceae bacterium]
MIDFEARRIIEALRSGVSSRAASRYFSSARPQLMEMISNSLYDVRTNGASGGLIVSGSYGEGKTHLLNAVFNMAQKDNMVVSFVSLSKETPFDKLYLVYQKLINNTYLPDRMQPGFNDIFENMTPNSPFVAEMNEYSLSKTETNKLYYLIKSYLNTEDYDEKFMLLADIEGDFVTAQVLNRVYKRIFNEKVKSSVTFSKTKHIIDYFEYMSHLFLKLGYKGWVILFDEAELIGKFGKKTRLKAYGNMDKFLNPDRKLESVYSIFTFGASFAEDIIEGKQEFVNLDESFMDIGSRNSIRNALNAIKDAEQLLPLTQDEVLAVFDKLRMFHFRAYDWNCDVDMKEVYAIVEKRSRLLRTRIRAAVEFLDQLFQYGRAGRIKIDDLGRAGYDEDLTPLDVLIDESR